MPLRFQNHWEKRAFWLIFGMTLLRAVLSGVLGLGDDEAYYWDWSRRLQLSYYDHPAMVAWMIKIGTLIFGQTPFGVRVFGLACNGVSAYLLWYLGVRLFNRTAAMIGVSLYVFAPIFSLGGLLMVPDAPMAMLWAALLVVLWRIYGDGDRRFSTWTLAGAVLGVGMLSKYTIVLVAVSAIFLLLSDRDRRGEILSGRFVAAIVIAAALAMPIVIWNMQLGWPTLSFHLQERHTGGGGANFSRWGQYWASQAVALGPALLFGCIGVWILALRRWRERNWRFVLVLSAPTFILFTWQALFAEFKPHWPAPAYTLAFLGLGECLREGFGIISPRTRNFARSAFVVLVLLIFVPLNFLFYGGTIYPLIPKIARAVAPGAPWDPKFDPTNDLFGWPEAVDRARAIRAEFAARGEPEPFLSSSRYQLVSQIAFIAQERVWRLSPGRDQYSFWQKPEELAALKGRASIFITDHRFERDPRGDQIFESCEEQAPLVVNRNGEPARKFNIWICRGFLGRPTS